MEEAQEYRRPVEQSKANALTGQMTDLMGDLSGWGQQDGEDGKMNEES